MRFGRFLRNLFLWLVPVVGVWLVVTPIYNLFLIRATQNLLNVVESPNVTTLAAHKTHYTLIYRSDLRLNTSTGHVGSVRVTDTQFPQILTALLFLAMPGIALRKRVASLGWAALVSVFFHLISLVFWVQFVYATQLGDWSASHYGPFAQNFWGLGKHLLDLPLKFGFPLALWAYFFADRLHSPMHAGKG